MGYNLSTDILLEQDKLNVEDKLRANLFNWRGQFTPQFIDYLLDKFSEDGFVVCDPFSGSGTVLLECAQKNLSCHGFEINPAAHTMSRFYTLCNETREARKRLVEKLQEVISQMIEPYHDLPLLENSSKYREKFRNLIDFAEMLFSRLSDKNERSFALNMVFTAENRRTKDLYSAVTKAFNVISKTLIQMPYTRSPVRAYLSDARLLHRRRFPKANLILQVHHI